MGWGPDLGALAWKPGVPHLKQARVRWPGVPLEPAEGWTRAPLGCGVCRQGAGPGRGGLKEAVGGRGGRETSWGWVVRAVGVMEGRGWLSGLPGVRAWGGWGCRQRDRGWERCFWGGGTGWVLVRNSVLLGQPGVWDGSGGEAPGEAAWAGSGRGSGDSAVGCRPVGLTHSCIKLMLSALWS